MADTVEIVIKIPKETYDHITMHICGYVSGKVCGNDQYILGEAIKQGTPLPEHYGDLIDRNELLKTPMDVANYPSNYVRIAPTIIPATKGDNNADHD